MTNSQSRPAKALLTAGLCSLCLMSAATEQALSKTHSPKQPLTTVATVPSLKQISPSDMVTKSKSEPYESERATQPKVGGEKVAIFGLYRQFRRWRRIFS